MSVFKMKQTLLALKDDARDATVSKIKESDSYIFLMGIPHNRLAMYINDYPTHSAKYFILKCRMEDVDPIKADISKCVELLWDQEFKMEDYKSIGYNDGMIHVLSKLFDALDMEAASKEVLKYAYNID